MKKGLRIPPLSKTRVKLFSFEAGMNGSIDGRLAPPALAKHSFNFLLSDGALTDGMGIDHYGVTNGRITARIFPEKDIVPLKCFYYKRYDNVLERIDDRVMVYATNGRMYEWRYAFVKSCLDNPQSTTDMLIALFTVSDLSFAVCPSAVCYKFNGEDVIIFSTQTAMKIYNGYEVIDVEGVPDITSMCVHSERLFVTTGGEESSLWFSDDFNPTDWYVSLDKAGFIDFQDGKGRLLKVISFNNYVYIFRNYGISRLSAYGEQREFYVSNLVTGSGRLLRNAIVECGSRIIYLAEDGFYSFDGLSASRILRGYDKYLTNVENENAIGKFFNGNLYVALSMRFESGIERVMLVYNLSNASTYIFKGAEINDIEVIAANTYSTLLFTVENQPKLGMLGKNAQVYDEPIEKYWESNFSDFNIDGEKVLTKVTLFSTGNADMIIKSDKSSQSVKIFGSASKQHIPIGLKGETFSIAFKAKERETRVSKVSAYFSHF